MQGPRLAVWLVSLLLFLSCIDIYAQRTPCTTLGQTPSTAFPVCGTSTFTQTTVPLCETNDMIVPGCSGTGNAQYANKNPFFYKFTCFTAGTLGFVIAPLLANEDYDWQLFDITGHNPDDIFTDVSLIVTANWVGTYGNTGTSAAGVNFIQCGSDPTEMKPTFTKMPLLVEGHEYLLMVSHFTDGQSGYTLNFTGGTAVITDPTDPHLKTVKPDCDGRTLRLKLNKKMKCNSLTANGTEFSIFPAVTSVISATTTSCTSSFDFDEVTITLAASLPNGNYDLVINNGTDGNSLLDNCSRNIPAGEKVSFFYAVPRPIFADSVETPRCAPKEVKVYFPKRITCSSLAADGSDFVVTGGNAPVVVTGAVGACTNGLSDIVIVKFASPIAVKGDYQLTLRAGTDGSTIIDECNIAMPQQTLTFHAEDTVSAAFTYATGWGCRFDTLTFAHDGAHDVNSWNWTFNDILHISAPQHTIVFPASSTNEVRLIVSNGVCSDTNNVTVVLDNEVKAGFEMPDVICPEDALLVKDTSRGTIDSWQWNFGVIASSIQRQPAAVNFPINNIETFYPVKLKVTNNTIGCTDSTTRLLRVLNNCFIAVPSAFTPNNDGLNDFLSPNNAIKAKDLEFKVYNRWGQLVFHSRNWQDRWDGRVGGIPQSPGVFVWYLKYTLISNGLQVFQKGTTTLIR